MKKITKMLAVIGVVSSILTNVSAQDFYRSAVLPFSERGKGVKDLGAQVSDILFAELMVCESLWMVERAEMDKILKEAELNLSGVVNSADANKIGQLSGAQLLITGSVFKVGNKNFIVAKLIGTETSRVVGDSVKGSEDIDILVAKLAKKLQKTIKEKSEELMPKIVSREDRIESIKKQIGDAVKPKLFISITEEHVGRSAIYPAAETEMQVIAKALGFEVTEDESQADIIIKGEGFSEFAMRKGNLISVKARVEIKAVDKKQNIIAVDRQTSVEVDLVELMAGKKALQDASAKIAARLLVKICK